MKICFSVFFAMTLLGLGIQAQENESEAVLMVLEKESNLPVCLLSDQVRINSDFIPDNRIGNVDTASFEDIRFCEEEDVWNAVEEEMIVGMAAGTPVSFSPILPMISGGLVGCLIGYIHQYHEGRGVTTHLFERLIASGLVGVPSALIGSLVSIAFNNYPTHDGKFFFTKGITVGVPSAMIVGEVCRKYQWD